MNMLALHELIAGTGDGLHPDIVRVFEKRARLQHDPRIASLAERTPGMAVQAGPSPAGRAGLFVPGNVAQLIPAAASHRDETPNLSKLERK